MLIAAVVAVVVAANVSSLDVRAGADSRLYSDRAQGFAVRLPRGMEVDTSLGPVATVISDDRTRVEVFHELLGPDTVAENYIYYKSRPMRTGVDAVRILDDRELHSSRWSRIHQLVWTRRPLSRVEVDRRHYATWDFVVGPKEVWSVHVKSTDPEWALRHGSDVVDSFVVYAPTDLPRFRARQASERAAPLSDAARKAFDHYFARSARQTWGLFEHGTADSYASLYEIEERLGHRFQVLLEYILIDEVRTPSILANARREGRLVELTLQLAPPDGAASTEFVYGILDGRWDADLRRLAREIAGSQVPVLFRLNNEMNGDWVVYSGYWTSEDADISKETWRYVFRIFQEEGATNAIWIWNPHDRSFPPFKYNHAVMYDPGPEYYDVVGMTGYNNGTYYPNETWRTFDEIYGRIYDEYLVQFPGKPFMIAEFASSTIGGDKVAWIRNTMDRLSAYPNIKIAVWWNGIDMDGSVPARPYRLQGDAVMDAFAEGVRHYR
ncbi:MAG TPA: glycosyl hydrolase [Candidatus Binatia bacterium]|nr:glycosyl hydrolase [Candidatus Binatia bacterium]